MTSTSRNQVNRLLSLVPYLQSRGEISVTEAAEEFGVTPRTIRRDLNVLLFCGLPGLGMGDLIDVDFDALEEEGVIRLSNADYLSRPLRLDSTEGAALVVGLRALLEGAQGAEREVVARTLDKVEAAAGEAARVATQVALATPADATVATTRRSLLQAVAERRQVRLRHHSATRDEVTSREVDPIAVLTEGEHSYLDAWCHLVEDRRLFRLDRIVDAELLDQPVSVHAEAEPLDLSAGIFRPSADTAVATLRLRPDARWVTEYYPVESVAEEPDGRLLVRLRVADPAWLVRLVLRLGGSAQVLDPPDLAEQARRRAHEALLAYRT